MTNTPAKLREAHFFLRLLEQMERTGRPLLGNVHDLRDEYAFVLSGFLGACYAATEHLKTSADKSEVETFKQFHERIYGKGLRNLTVHERHISPSPTHYISVSGQTPMIIQFEYYFTPEEAVPVTSLCQQHYAALIKFAAQHGVRTEA